MSRSKVMFYIFYNDLIIRNCKSIMYNVFLLVFKVLLSVDRVVKRENKVE